MVKVGQKVRFDPFEYLTGFGASDNRGSYVVGTVVMVNEQNQWFSVEYGDPRMRTSFKFCDIAKGVDIIGN